MTHCAVWGMGVFWVLNAFYQALFPMPLPEDFRAVGWFLLGFRFRGLALFGCNRRQPGSPFAGELKEEKPWNNSPAPMTRL